MSDITNRPRHMGSKDKASHLDQIKISQKAHKRKRNDNEQNISGRAPDPGQLIGDQAMAPDDGDQPLGPDEMCSYTFFLEGEGNPPDLLCIDDAQLLSTQNDL